MIQKLEIPDACNPTTFQSQSVTSNGMVGAVVCKVNRTCFKMEIPPKAAQKKELLLQREYSVARVSNFTSSASAFTIIALIDTPVNYIFTTTAFIIVFPASNILVLNLTTSTAVVRLKKFECDMSNFII